MTAQGWIVLGLVAIALLYFARQVVPGFSKKPAGSSCSGCSGSCSEKPVNIRPEDGRKV